MKQWYYTYFPVGLKFTMILGDLGGIRLVPDYKLSIPIYK